MKRAAVFGMVVVVVASAWTYLAAQSSPSPPAKATFDEPTAPAAPKNSKSQRDALSVPQSRTFDQPGAQPLTPLQQRYVDLATKKARLMTEEQLQQAVNEMDHQVDELNAWSKVEEGARALREVIEKHPQSRAAATARSLIRIIDQGRPTNSPEDSFSPRPDRLGQPSEQFERQPAHRPAPEPNPSSPP
jgi:TolA-binding protein